MGETPRTRQAARPLIDFTAVDATLAALRADAERLAVHAAEHDAAVERLEASRRRLLAMIETAAPN